MTAMSILQMKEAQLGILNYFDQVCKENKIKWWIDFGTLIGAVRHRGFIPWDDDVDVSMLREDYEKLKEVFETKNKNSKEQYRLMDPEIDKDYDYSFGKVIDTKTVLYEGEKERIKIGVYIDVFVYDNAPREYKKYKKMLKTRDLLGKIRNIKLFCYNKKKATIRSYLIVLIKLFLSIVPMNTILRLMQKNAKKYISENTGKIADFLWPYGNFSFYVDKDFFNDIIELEFEGNKYPAPAKYDQWLRLHYGDYMKIPPVEERTHHNVKAFFID